jgi:hypothetical protein
MHIVKASLAYFPLWARGPGPALALSHAKLPWECKLPEDWETMKPTTDFSKLPILTITDTRDKKFTISHELAILGFVGRVRAEMAGETHDDWSISTQLMGECEDVYGKLTNFQPTTRVAEKCSREELEEMWNKVPDFNVHNRNQGFHCNLSNLERFVAKYSRDKAAGKFTTSGNSIGECKLFSTLHTLKMCEPTVLDSYARLGEFYERFGELGETKAVTKDTIFNQYFVRG